MAEDILSFGLSALIVTFIPKPAALRILEAGLPVVHLSEADSTHPRLATLGGYYDSARLAGEFVAERLKGRGRVAVIGGYYENTGEGGTSRITAIEDVFQRFPEIGWQHIPAPWMYELAYPVIEKALKSDANGFDAIIGISDPLALAARNALHGLDAPKSILVGINGDPLALAAVAKGSLTATIEIDAAR